MTLANSLSGTGIGSPTSKSACMIYDETKGSRTGAGFGLCTGSPAGVAIEKPERSYIYGKSYRSHL